VPVVIPKVWLPEVPLVVTARICGTGPFWPSNRMVPTPQPALLARSPCSWAQAAGPPTATARSAEAITIRIAFPPKTSNWQ
jgi:hypothetical protein